MATVRAVLCRHLAQHGEAFGHQVAIHVKGGQYDGAEDLQQAHVVALNIPGDLCGVGPQLHGASQRLRQPCRQGGTACRGEGYRSVWDRGLGSRSGSSILLVALRVISPVRVAADEGSAGVARRSVSGCV